VAKLRYQVSSSVNVLHLHLEFPFPRGPQMVKAAIPAGCICENGGHFSNTRMIGNSSDPFFFELLRK
jgi:hypothetical protein